MRSILATIAALGMLAASGAVPRVALAIPHEAGAATAFVQEPPIDVQIEISDRGGWWADPVWVAIGVIALVLVVVVVAMAARGGGTTVIKE